jgi:hypothetical protein
MSPSIRRLGLLAATFAACLPAPAVAWRELGHEIVAEIAARQLTPQATAMVEDLLGDRAGPALRAASGWADEIRADQKLGITAPYHFINFPPGTCSFVAARDCPGGRCVVSALERFTRQLREGESREARTEALKWVLHLVADVHQPLHAGLARDRGGNDFQVRFEGEGTNLHAVLDGHLLRTRGLQAVPYAQALLAELPAPADDDVDWHAGAPAQWAGESCEMVESVYPTGRRIEPGYVAAIRPRLEERLLLAGYRLGQLLNAAAAS